MANSFINRSAIAGTTSTDIYTVPTSSSAVAFGLILSNTSTTPQWVTVEIYDDSDTISRTLGFELPVPVSSSLTFPKIALEENDVLRFKSGNTNSIEGFANILLLS